MDKKALKLYIENLINRGSSPAELARRCGVSDTAMSQFRSGKYGANDDNLAAKIASGLYFYENSRNVVDSVTSYKQVMTAFTAAKKRVNGYVSAAVVEVEKHSHSSTCTTCTATKV